MEERVILLVEDNPDDAELTLRAFKRNNITNQIVTAADGVEALDYLFGRGVHAGRLLKDLPAVVLLDLKMPRMDGMGVLERMRGEDLTRSIPVVILTSSSEEADMRKSYELGANSYIRKPVDFNRFTEAVKHIGLYWLLWNELPSVEMKGET